MARSAALILSALLVAAAAWIILSHRAESKKSTLTSSNASDYRQWTHYESPVSKFKVFLPTLPQNAGSNLVDSKTGKKKRFSTFISPSGDGSIYMVNVIYTLDPDETSNDDAEMNQAIQDMVHLNQENQLIQLNKTVFQEQPAYDFTIQNGKGKIMGKAFKKGPALYILSTMDPNGEANPDDRSLFTNSLKIGP